jgi:hypothetical protein
MSDAADYSSRRAQKRMAAIHWLKTETSVHTIRDAGKKGGIGLSDQKQWTYDGDFDNDQSDFYSQGMAITQEQLSDAYRMGTVEDRLKREEATSKAGAGDRLT